MSAPYQDDITAPAAFPTEPNVVLPESFESIIIANMAPATSTTSVAYIMFADPAGASPPNPVRLVPGSPVAGMRFTKQSSKQIWIKGDGAPVVQIVAEGVRR
jgi:hypothetical protein